MNEDIKYGGLKTVHETLSELAAETNRAARAEAEATRLGHEVQRLGAELADAYARISELEAALNVARSRCVDILQMVRFDEIDSDFRTIIHNIDTGQTAEDIRADTEAAP